MAAKSLVVVGSVNADLVLPIERLPQPGETLGASSLETLPGGKGANQAAAAAKLGYPTYFVGQIGTDANAPLLKAAMREAGADLAHLKDVPGPSGTALILLQANGENSIIIVGGANQAAWDLTPGAKAAVGGAGAVLLQREIPESVNVQVAQLAKAAGVPVFLDAGGVEGPISHDLLACVTLLSPNETELARLTGLPTDDEAQIRSAAEALQKLGVGSVLVKLGGDGSLLLPGGGGEPIRQKAIPAPKVVDTTGAGDCFTAAYAVAVLQGRVGADALRFASAAASICVTRKGAMPSLPSRIEVDALLASHQ
uniref:Ribokinase n=1 Tax=Chlamydomonas leiostraca TaxID=1034604 RepID=A0A7S0X1M1_9CHLO|eukprot:CAMPEP_0202863886 /NCGR_PEP_ID=MMETSP1391-20130828/4345_1 /ASSEMBLY_ACC=CAM_ASM_000867 /TAXON_ID=1034604 /ORGANISM="Chlamydomonas leiostraca, Strain SAG 11-49" /LENGTH=310 /DNA_ID=CAMNT_0049543569 /DNA_START=14 /DNA_END=946 /DNA_ORIENTATION=-